MPNTTRWILAVFLMLAAPDVALTAPAPGGEITPGADPKWELPSTVSPEARQAFTAIRAQRAADPLGPARVGDQDPETWRRLRRERIERTGAPAVLPDGVTQETLGGTPVLRIQAAPKTRTGSILIYVHGGGYVFFSARSSLALPQRMARNTGLTVLSVDYAIAPEGDWKTATAQVVGVYRALLAEGYRPGSIGLFGDSAGGGLVAGATLRLRDEGLPLPGALVLISPWTDVTDNGDSYATLAPWDAMLDGPTLMTLVKLYAAPADQRRPYVSPVYGDFSKPFPPTLIQGGTRDILLSGFVRFYRALDDAGREAQLDLYEAMPHNFPSGLSDTPEGRRAADKAAAFFGARLKASP